MIYRHFSAKLLVVWFLESETPKNRLQFLNFYVHKGDRRVYRTEHWNQCIQNLLKFEPGMEFAGFPLLGEHSGQHFLSPPFQYYSIPAMHSQGGRGKGGTLPLAVRAAPTPTGKIFLDPRCRQKITKRWARNGPHY